MSTSSSSTEPLRYDKFLHAIGRFICPDPPNEPGLACVMGKRLYHPQINSHSVTEKLSAGDESLLRKVLRKHTGNLPQLRPRMRDDEISKFLAAYRSLKDRPAWEPRIYSDFDLTQIRDRRLDVRREHDTQLKAEIAQGRIRLFDFDHVLQKAPHFEIITYIPRADAQAYLEKVGLSLPEVLGVIQQTGGQERKNRRWTENDKSTVIALVDNGNVEKAVEVFVGCSAKYLKQCAERWKAEQAEEKEIEEKHRRDIDRRLRGMRALDGVPQDS